MNRYICEWEKDDSPTRTMSEKEAREYFKAHSVAGDCRFSLRDDTTLPDDIVRGWQKLLDQVYAVRKETNAHRQTRDALRRCYRLWADGQSYTVPAIAAMPAKPAKRQTCCPQCGFSVAA